MSKLEIVHKNASSKQVHFCQLDPGDVFKICDHIYVKSQMDYKTSNAYNLTHYKTGLFSPNELVTPVKSATLTIEE